MLEYGNVDESIQMFKLIRDKYDSTELRMLDHDFTTKRIYFLDNAYYSREDLLKYNAAVKSFKEYTKKKTIECISKDNKRTTYSVNDIYLDETFYSFKYWKCVAGKDYLYIDLNGDIYPCMKYYERKSNMIGNINSMSKIKFRHVICPFDRCPCVWEATKEKVLKNIL